MGSTNTTISSHIQETPNNSRAGRLALTTILRRKGRILDALTDSFRTLRQNLTPSEKKLLDELNTTRSQLAAITFRGTDDIPNKQYHTLVDNLRVKANDLENELACRSADFRAQSQLATIESIQQNIPSDAALVELVRYAPFKFRRTQLSRKWESPRYAAYIVHAEGDPQWVDLGEAEIIEQKLRSFRDNLRDIGTPIDAQLKPSARALDALIMEPIRKRLGNTRKILLVPDSQLNLVPFGALVDENNEYLIENYTITILTSGRDLLSRSSTSANAQSPVFLANPYFNRPGNANALHAQTKVRSSQRRSRDVTRRTVSPLPETAAEVKAIAQLLPNVQLLTESEATENAVKQLQSPKILHLATHGFFFNIERVAPPDLTTSSLFQDRNGPRFPPVTQENPLLRSGLALAGFNIRESGDQDGVLTALEVAGLDLRGTQLVVMSACDTGVGDVANGEGVYGLRRAFVIAGAESQLFSLWKVDDLATKDLMVNYYQRLLNQEGRSEALRQTQLEVLRSQQYQHPYYWAAFVPSGDWGPIK